jgi:uncharacterized protein YkvS
MEIRKFIFTSLIIAILFFLVGFFSSYFLFVTGQATEQDGGFDAGWQAAQNRLIDLGIIQQVDPGQIIKSLTGEVEKVDDNSIFLKIIPLEPLADPSLDRREVVVSSDTVIKQYKKKTEDEYRREMEEYKGKISKDENFDKWQQNMPSPYELEVVGIDSVSPGMDVTVKADENIRKKKKMRADEIIIQL